MNNSPIAIQTEGLTKVYGPRCAVNDLSLSISRGEIFSLLGTNGAGKTTTIKMLSCLIQPSEGTASLQGYDIREHPQSVKKIIGVSPQETAITGHLTVKENLLLMGGVYGLSNEASKARAQELIKLMGLEERKEQTRKLSGGLQRRLSIAMAMMSDPEILFLDEPTLGLDPAARKSVWDYIIKLKGKKTILLTTHYLEEADHLSDRIAIIHDGNIIAQGTPKELKDRHSSIKKIYVDSDNIAQDCIEDLKNNGIEASLLEKGLIIRSSKPDLYSIMDILKKHKVEISGMNWEEPTLDEVFLKLTGEEETI
jgi:ABC-2 type transport system ATP-binding protein